MKHALTAAACAVAAFLVLGCDGGPSQAPSAPAPPPAPPPPPPFSASFAAGSPEVREGEAIPVGIDYRVRDLASAVMLRISAAVESASAEDFELDVDTVEIPAGQDVSGTVSLEIRALTDSLFSEGDETLNLALERTGAAANATLGEPVAVTIVEAGASPCPGVTVRAEPWREEEWRESRKTTMLASILEIDLIGGALDTRFELIGPYYDLYEGGNTPRSIPTFGINSWRVLPGPDGVGHELTVNWPGESWFEEETQLQFRFLGPTCSGEPIASCSSEGCDILP